MYKSLEIKIKSRQLAVILRRYSLPEVPWRRIHNVIAYAMSMFNNTPHSALSCHSLPHGAREESSVAFSNKVMDTRDWHSQQGVPPKYDVEREDFKVSKCDMRCGVLQCGRSMIEMLGVLAIIGVLSVGGIAGYSKAMEKWKINKTIEEYSMLINGLIEYKDNFSKNTPAETNIYLPDFVQAAHLVPETWKKGGIVHMYDSLGNKVNMYFSNTGNRVGDRFVFDIFFAQSKSSNNSLAYNLCTTFYKDVGIAMSSNVLAMIVQGGKHYAYGETVCHSGVDDKGNPRRCLRDMTLSEISDICKTCEENNCAVYFVF